MDSLVKRLQEVAGGLSEAGPQQYQLTPQQQELNDLRLSTANRAAGLPSVLPELSTGDQFSLALGNILGSAQAGKGALPGAQQFNQQVLEYNTKRNQANADQINRAAMLAGSTRMEQPNANPFSDAVQLVGNQMNMDFKAQQAEANRQLKIQENEANRRAALQKEQIKKQAGIDKENRKQLLSLTDTENKTQQILDKLEDAYKTFKDYSENSWTGTGPFATAGGLTKYTSESTQLLDSKFKSLNLDELVKTFAGLAKAIDSEADRRAFESAQPSISNDDAVNESLFASKIQAAKNILEKTRRRKMELDPRYQRFQELKQRYNR